MPQPLTNGEGLRERGLSELDCADCVSGTELWLVVGRAGQVTDPDTESIMHFDLRPKRDLRRIETEGDPSRLLVGDRFRSDQNDGTPSSPCRSAGSDSNRNPEIL